MIVILSPRKEYVLMFYLIISCICLLDVPHKKYLSPNLEGVFIRFKSHMEYMKLTGREESSKRKHMTVESGNK